MQDHAGHAAADSSQQHCFLLPRLIPGRLNVIAGGRPRDTPLATEWTLHPAVFYALHDRYPRMVIDVFATRHSSSAQVCVSFFRIHGRTRSTPSPRRGTISTFTCSPCFSHPVSAPKADSMLSPCNLDSSTSVTSTVDQCTAAQTVGALNPVASTSGSPVSARVPRPSSRPVHAQPSRLSSLRRTLEIRGYSHQVVDRILTSRSDTT